MNETTPRIEHSPAALAYRQGPREGSVVIDQGQYLDPLLGGDEFWSWNLPHAGCIEADRAADVLEEELLFPGGRGEDILFSIDEGADEVWVHGLEGHASMVAQTGKDSRG